MKLNKQGYFMLRNDALSNIEYAKEHHLIPQVAYKIAETCYYNGYYEEAEKNFNKCLE